MTTWKEAIEDFLNGLHGTRAEKTCTYYQTQLRQLQFWAEEEGIALTDFRGRQMRTYIKHRSETVGERTRLHDARCAKVFFRFCAAQEYAPVDALKDYTVPRAAKAHVKKPSAEELEKFLAAIGNKWDAKQNPNVRFLNKQITKFCRTRDTAMFAFLIGTACRKGEMLALTVENLDLDRRTATFPVTKGGEPRTVPLPADLVPLLCTWLSQRRMIEDKVAQEKKRGKEVLPVAPNVFINRLGDAVQERRLSKVFEGYVEYAGLEHFTLHGIRHYALHEVAKVNLRSAQQIAGHKSLNTTAIYLHNDPEAVRSDADKANLLGQVLQHKRGASQRRRII